MALPTVTVEIAFSTDPDATVPNYQNVSAYAMGFSVRRGRQYELDTIQASTLTIRFANGDRRFDPSYTHSPYYPYVLPMRKIRVSATWQSVTYYLFTGYIERWPLSWEAPKWGAVDVVATDGLAALSQASLSGDFAEELTGARITEILTAAAWSNSTPAAGFWTLDTSTLGTTTTLSYGVSATLIDDGQSLVQAATIPDDGSETALAHIQEIADAERGVFFIDGQGRAVFHDRSHRFNLASSVTFADSAFSSTRLPYQDLVPDFDVTRIVNEVKVTRTGGVTQTASDGQSIQAFLRRTLSLTPPLTTDTEALVQAQFELALRKDAELRFDKLTVMPAGYTSTWPHALGRELGDKITVEHTTGASSAITAETLSQTCFIEAIDHTVGADFAKWETSFQLSPASHFEQFFVLGTAALDSATSAVLVY
jgi:hypothetical protein